MSFDFVSPGASSSSPYSRLYRHALESIFAHLTLSELGRVSSTCRDWSAAVDSMRPIGACITWKLLTFRSIGNSRLMRQVTSIYIHNDFLSEIAVLCDIIKQSKSLDKLELTENWFDDDIATTIAEAIGQSKSLTTVDLYKKKTTRCETVSFSFFVYFLFTPKREKKQNGVASPTPCACQCRAGDAVLAHQ